MSATLTAAALATEQARRTLDPHAEAMARLREATLTARAAVAREGQRLEALGERGRWQEGQNNHAGASAYGY